MMQGRVFALIGGRRFLAVACVLLVTSASARAMEPDSHEPPGLSSEQRIDLFLDHPAVATRIRATGMRASHIRHSLGTLSVHERETLANLLERGWPGVDHSHQVTLTADYLMLVTLMRESRLFASVVTPLASASGLGGAKKP